MLDGDRQDGRKQSSGLLRQRQPQQQLPANPAPWRRQHFYSPHVLGLHEEIIDFYEFIKPIPEEEFMRNRVVQRIESVVYRLWPEAKVEIFGSFATKLYLPTSDIDLMIMGKWEVSPLYTLKSELVTAEVADEENVTVLDKASVPIVKVVDKETGVRVDISFNTSNGVNSANLIRVSRAMPPLLPLTRPVLPVPISAGVHVAVPQSGETGHGAEAVPVSARLERGVHWGHLLVQPDPDDDLLPAASSA